MPASFNTRCKCPSQVPVDLVSSTFKVQFWAAASFQITAETDGSFSFSPSPDTTRQATFVSFTPPVNPGEPMRVEYALNRALPEINRFPLSGFDLINSGDISPFLPIAGIEAPPITPTQLVIIVAQDGKGPPAAPITLEYHNMLLSLP